MLNYNHKAKFYEQVNKSIDIALVEERKNQKPRNYLGASRLGVKCSRSLQYECTK